MKNLYSSPDKKHTYGAVLAGRVEVRFGEGPKYYNPSINGKKHGGTIVGEVFCWSPDSKYLALQEWLTILEYEGPITRVTIIDLEKMRYWNGPELKRGMVKDFLFSGDQFSYVAGENGISACTIKLDKIKEWKKLNDKN